MKKLLDKLAALVTVKSIVTLALLGTFVYLSASGTISAEDFMRVFLVIITFYFGVQTTKGKE